MKDSIEKTCRLLAEEILNDDLQSLRIDIGQRDSRIATLEAERDKARSDAKTVHYWNELLSRDLKATMADSARAVRALQRAGFTLAEGASEWKPPIGTRPDFEEIDRLRDALAEKRGAIDDTFACLDGVAHISKEAIKSMADRLRPHATPTPATGDTDAGVTPVVNGVADRVDPVGKPQPANGAVHWPAIGIHHPDDPLQTEWTDDGFRITKQPEEWRDNFDETHAGICVRSASCPDWCGELWLRGEETETDSDDVRVTAADRPRVWAAICSLNAKHRPKASQPAPAEPSGDRALRLVKRLALFTSRFDMRNCGEARAELDAIIAECDGATK